MPCHSPDTLLRAVSPPVLLLGQSLQIDITLASSARQPQRLAIDYAVHHVKAGGHTSAKVFKLKVLSLGPKETVRLSKTVSTAEMTTRKHYAGLHRVEVLLNGQARALGVFELLDA